MTQFTALHTHPVLHIDTGASPAQLFDTALARLQAGADLLDSLASIHVTDADEQDLNRFAMAASILLRDGVDMLEVVRGTI